MTLRELAKRAPGRRISAAMIVRDEAQFIEDCLQSLCGTVDEIVLVDTGSRDDTIKKAMAFPVTLHHFAWCNDFSAARNFALDQATGDWILYIDADERFSIPAGTDIDAILGDDSKAAWAVRFYPRIDWTPYAEPRIFRNDPRIRFAGVVHESMRPGIARVAREDGKSTGICSLQLQHVGYESDQTYKNPRNIPLLRERLTAHPDHSYSWWHLGHCLSLEGRDDEAIVAYRKGVEAALAHPSATGPLADSLAAVALITALVKRKQEVGPLLGQWLERCPNHMSLRWIAATLALESGNPEAAGADLEMMAAIDPDSFFDPQVAYSKDLFRYQAKEALALYHFRVGNYSEAARRYRAIAPLHPEPESCVIKARLAELRAGISPEAFDRESALRGGRDSASKDRPCA